MGTQPYQVGVDTREFIHHDPHPLRLRWNLEAQQLFNRQTVGEVVSHGAEIVDAIGKRNDLLIELGLAGLLDSGVEVADLRHDAHDSFAIDLEDKPQHAMGRRMLGPHVQDKSFLLTCNRFEHGGRGILRHDPYRYPSTG